VEVTGTLRDVLRVATAARATDLVFTIDMQPLARVDGTIAPLREFGVVDEQAMSDVLHQLLDRTQLATLRRELDLDFAFSVGQERFRGNVFYQRGCPTVTLRLIHNRIPSVDEVGLPRAVRELTRLKQGLVLFCGPTGCGKSTTMASLVEAINQTRACHILTIEDPIEYLHTNDRAVVHQREVGFDTSSFTRALRAALREDPDVVLVGEMRDPESIAITLTLAETGHLVLSSLHTNDAPQTLDRIVDVFPGVRQPQIRLQLASTLAAVVAQRLVPRVNRGLVAAFEVLVGTQAVSNLIREGKTRQLRNVMQIARSDGHQTLEMSLNNLVAHGIITRESALATAFHPQEIEPEQRAHPRAGSSAS